MSTDVEWSNFFDLLHSDFEETEDGRTRSQPNEEMTIPVTGEKGEEEEEEPLEFVGEVIPLEHPTSAGNPNILFSSQLQLALQIFLTKF